MVSLSRETDAQTDGILLPFLLSSNEAEGECLLADLLSKYAAPSMEKVIRSTFAQSAVPEMTQGTHEAQDIEDIVGEVNIKILDRLRRLKKSPSEDTISDFRGYVAATAYNVCHTYVRGKYPNRTRLKNKLRYILTHHPDFGLWQGSDGKLICGLSQWMAQHRRASSAWITQARMDPEKFVQGIPGNDVIELIRAAFMSAGAPIHLEDLVNFTAEILKITDEPPGNDVQLEYLRPSNLAADFIDPVDAEGKRLYLKRLWDEIVQLPLAQRVALLLAVRDAGRTSIAVLLLEIPIASMREIAEAVGMSANEFAKVFCKLPLDDYSISRHLNVSRQQVTSYRLSARRRLARRMACDGSGINR
jgi:hypothetical protein